jgi:hypothetical protein
LETLEIINKRLHENYGETENMPNFRIVWSEDQFEFRSTNFTDEGFQLLHPEVRKLPKYKQWIKSKYLLERLTAVPFISKEELADAKISYEPLWVFEDVKGFPVLPTWAGAKFVIETVHEQVRTKGAYTKYKDPDDGLTESQAIEKKNVELQSIQDELFGNESTITDALAYKQGVGFTKEIK